MVASFREKKKLSRKGGNTKEGRLLNVGYLQDQDARHIKQLAEKDALLKEKKEAKKERKFQAEC